MGTTGAAWITKSNRGESQKVMAFSPDDGSLWWETPIGGRIEEITLDTEGKRLAVLHSRTHWIDSLEEIESIDDISLVDMATHGVHVNAKPGTSEKEGIHSISFAPDGSLVAYTYPDTVKAFTIQNGGLYAGKDGKVFTAAEIQQQEGAGSPADGAAANPRGLHPLNRSPSSRAWLGARRKPPLRKVPGPRLLPRKGARDFHPREHSRPVTALALPSEGAGSPQGSGEGKVPPNAVVARRAVAKEELRPPGFLPVRAAHY